MTIIGEGRIGCSNHRERGSCSNNKRISIERVENTVLEGVKEQMLRPALIEEFEKAYHAKMQELSAAEDTSVADHERAIQTVTHQIEKIVDSIAVAGPLPPLTSRLKELEAKKESLLRNKPIQFSCADITLPRKDMTSAYRARIERFQESLNADPELKIEATGQLRTLVKSIVVHPLPEKGRAALEITGDISALAVLNQPNQKTAVSLVAEEGVEIFN
jgi:site-specific DNA recombinase